MTGFCCPICQEKLMIKDKSYICGKNHCFDIAKSGYVNLLPSNKMNSKAPGDNKLMVDTRNQFLNKGYYMPLLDALSLQTEQVVKTLQSLSPLIADVGCGEGYYTNGVCSALKIAGYNPHILGVDISKNALAYAAKRAKLDGNSITEAEFAVASVFDLPIESGLCDILIELFAPYNGEEFARVLKKGGYMLLVIPAENHLFELKQAVYDNPYKNDVKPYELEGFEFVKAEKISYTMNLENNEDIKNLFLMTPYGYKTSKQDTQRLMGLESLTTTVEFELLIYKK